MSVKNSALKLFDSWYRGLPIVKQLGSPARGTIAAALIVLERLKSSYDLNLDSHRSERGKSQIIGASGAAVARVLATFGENRPFLSEGGRTNRGGPGAIYGMLKALDAAKLDKLPTVERNGILEELQGFLAARVVEFHNRQRLKFSYDPGKSTWQCVHELLDAARETGKEGQVAQYLIGAKLQLRFPSERVQNESYSAADDQTGRHGDFTVKDTVFHVTVSPMPQLYEKCARNVRDGFRVYLIVPDRTMVGARQNIEALVPGRIAVESIESFVSQNVEEISSFSKQGVVAGFRQLLEKYNERVNLVENDKSMLIEIPPNLRE